MPRWRRVLAQIWPRVAIVALIVAIWWAVYEAGLWDRVLLPSPALEHTTSQPQEVTPASIQD